MLLTVLGSAMIIVIFSVSSALLTTASLAFISIDSTNGECTPSSTVINRDSEVRWRNDGSNIIKIEIADMSETTKIFTGSGPIQPNSTFIYSDFPDYSAIYNSSVYEITKEPNLKCSSIIVIK